MKRMRGRNHRQGGGGGGGFRNQQNGIPLNRNHVFDSSGPEMRVRGTAQQLFDKYTQLARDAASSGDRVLGEAYYQHAEHYFRIISAINQAQGVPNQPQGGQQNYNNPQPAEGEGEQPRQEHQHRQEFRQDRQDRQERHDRQDRQDNRDARDNRDNRQDRRFEPRQRQEFQPRDRNEQRPYRQPQAPIAEAPIDISSALEAELAAAVAEPPGLSEQPSIQHELAIPTPELRAIPISAEAPPPAEEPAAPAPRRRGRPRAAKAEAASE